MRVIIAPTDFSPVSLNAVNYAAGMASSMKANLALLYVVIVPISIGEVPYPSYDLDMLKKEGEARIQILKEELDKSTGGKIKIYTNVTIGTVSSEIASYAEQLTPFAVVMGTQGSSAVERVLFGSTTVNAMKHLPWPLIVVPPGAKFTGIKKIGLACDLEDVVNSSPIEEVRSLVKDFGAKLFVLHVTKSPVPVYGPEKIEASGLLHEMLEELHPTYRFFDDKDVEEGLLEFAADNKIDMLISFHKKHNIIEQLFRKSHSKKLILHTHLPVMTVHEP